MATTLVIFGAAGDLTSRLLLPGLAAHVRDHGGADLQLIGSDRRPVDDADWRQRVRTACTAAGVAEADTETIVAAARWQAADVTSGADLTALFETVAPGRCILYFALPPAVTRRSCEALATIQRPQDLQLAMEKPFGFDLASARELNWIVQGLVPEEKIFRIDHFLGEAMVQQLLAMRLGNRMLAQLWSRDHVERVDIVWDETLGLEGRAEFYDPTGALRDMHQSHLLQVLAMVATEPPASLTESDLRDGLAAALRATRIAGDDPVGGARRARYTAGVINGRPLPDYAAEPGVDPARNTETLAELDVEVDTDRWRGVPFRLRSGKGLAADVFEVVLTLRAPETSGVAVRERPDRIVFCLDPHTVTFEMAVGVTDPLGATEDGVAVLDLGESPPAYARVVGAILAGDPLLSLRADQAEESWRIIEPVVQAWEQGRTPLAEYPAGTTGPQNWS